MKALDNEKQKTQEVKGQLYRRNYVGVQWLGPFMADIDAHTPFFYIFRDKELVYDLFEAVTGIRMMYYFFRIGGKAVDLPHGWIDKCLDFYDYFLTGTPTKLKKKTFK